MACTCSRRGATGLVCCARTRGKEAGMKLVVISIATISGAKRVLFLNISFLLKWLVETPSNRNDTNLFCLKLPELREVVFHRNLDAEIIRGEAVPKVLSPSPLELSADHDPVSRVEEQVGDPVVPPAKGARSLRV